MTKENGKPQIRFAEFDDAWEQRKYADVIELISGQDFNPEEYNEEGIGVVRQIKRCSIQQIISS